MERKVYIYGLYEIGKEDEIRYVGKSNNPKSRIYSHMSSSRNHKSKPTHKECWINNVINNGGKIWFKIIEEVNIENWSDKEIYWISKYNNLTNTSPGGETGITGSKFKITYDECKKWVSENLPQIKKRNDWLLINDTLPDFIPKSPNTVFIEKWISWSDFLGSNNISSCIKSKKYLSYNDCKSWFKENININNLSSWNSLIKILPEFIPKKPTEHFKNEWISWIDFIGIDFSPKKYVTYSECLKLVREFNITNIYQYTLFIKENINLNMPKSPHITYKEEWISYCEFFMKKQYKFNISYNELYLYAKDNLYFIKSSRQWKLYISSNKLNIPTNPQSVFKNKGWISWYIFLNK